MQLFLHTSWQPKETHEDPHWRENTQVCSVWLFFHSLSDAGKSHADPYRRCVINVLIPVLSLKIWKYTSANTQERNCDQCGHTIALAGTLKVHTRETLRIWAVWLFLCSFFSSEAQTHWRKAFQVRPVQLFLHWSWWSKNTQTQIHRRKTFQLWPMWLLLYSAWMSESTQA